MNLTLVDVSCRPLEGKVQEMEFMYIKGRHVRCVLSRMPCPHSLQVAHCGD